MLEIIIQADKLWDEVNEEFINIEEQKLQLEHSLISLSKWESKWCKPFFSKKQKTDEEIFDYIRCMTITKNVDPNVFRCLSAENIRKINSYIEAPMTATTLHEEKNNIGKETITSELIYYWMIAQNIPFECQKWHINRLITLIRVCGVKNAPPKKMNKRDMASRNAAINAARRKQLNTKG